MTSVRTAADAAGALEPLPSPLAALLFAVGILSTGMIGIPVLAGSAA